MGNQEIRESQIVWKNEGIRTKGSIKIALIGKYEIIIYLAIQDFESI